MKGGAVFYLMAGAIGSLLGISAWAQEPPAPAEKTGFEAVTYNLIVSGSYTYNFNHPDSGKNQYRVFDFDDQRIKLDTATFTVQKPADKPGLWGFRVDMAAGSSEPEITAARGFFRNAETGEAHDFDIMQAYVSYDAPVGRGLRFDLGKFFAPMSYESASRYDAYNDNASRSFLFGYAVPATNTGLKISYPFTDKVTGMVMVVQGWDNVKDNNSSKSVGAGITYVASPAFNVSLDWIGGPEQTDNTSHQRNVLDLYATWKLCDKITLGINADYGHEALAIAPDQSAQWSGVALYVIYAFSDRFSLGFRAERFDDRQGARTGIPQTLKEVTLTPTFKVGKHWVFRGDLRRDWSDKAVFQEDAGYIRHQPTASFNILFVY
jgi:hypothetical protein